MVHKPSLKRSVRMCVSRGGKRGAGYSARYGSLVVAGPKGLLGLGDFLGFL